LIAARQLSTGEVIVQDERGVSDFAGTDMAVMVTVVMAITVVTADMVMATGDMEATATGDMATAMQVTATITVTTPIGIITGTMDAGTAATAGGGAALGMATE
jgi:hypothetical protein